MAAPQNPVSVSRRPPDVEDYIDILRRYRSWVIGPTFAGLVISMMVAFWWPDTYACWASMQIKPGAATDLLPSAGSGGMAQRLQQLQLEILGRDSLITLIQDPKLDLYKKERQRYPVEDIAEDMTRKGHVKIIPFSAESTSRGAQAFRIWFEYYDRVKARSVVLALVTAFQNKNLTYQEAQATTKTTFMDDLVRAAKEKLERVQSELSAFTAENQSRLPMGLGGFGNAASDGGFGAVAANLEVTAKNNLITDLNEQIGRERQTQLMLEGSLQGIANQKMQVEQNLTVTQSTNNQTVTNTKLINLDQQLAIAKAELEALKRKYQPDFPDVLAKEDTIRALEQHRDEIQQETAGAGQPGSTVKVVPNPQAQQQLTQLNNDEATTKSRILISQQAVERAQARINQATKELTEIQSKIANSPPIIQKYNTLRNELAMAQGEYENLSKTKNQSDTSQSMEEHRAGETLEVLEQPITPETPTFPNRPEIVAAGTLAGLAFGMVLAAAKEIKNTSLKNLKDVRAYTNLPVLSSIPLLENALLVRRKRRLAWLAWSSALIIGSILMCGAVYYHLVIAQQVS